MTKLDSRLQQALEQIEAGIEPAAAIAAVSEGLDAAAAAELTELVRLAVALRELPAPRPVRAALPASVVNAARDLRIAQSKPPRWYERLRWRELATQAYVLGFGLLMLAIFSGVFIMPAVMKMVIGEPTHTPAVEVSPTPTVPAPSTIMTADTPTPASTPTDPLVLPPPLFQIPFTGPIISRGSADKGDWDAVFTDPGAVIEIDDRLIMFRNGSRDSLWPTHYMTGLNVSETGSTWEDLSNPIFKTDDVPFSSITEMVTGAVQESDGSITMYYYTYTALTLEYATSFIGRANAPSVEGPYIADPTPVLKPGSEGMWDDFAVRHPSVIRTESGYLMAYTGINYENAVAIGIATSPDGITWTKHNDPSTGGAYAESDPVLVTQDGEWDSYIVFNPSIVQTPNGFLMSYRGGGGRKDDKNLIGLALSEDGINWTRYENNPVFNATDLHSNASVEHVTMTYYHEALYLYLEIFLPPLRGSNIWMAVYEGEMP